MVTITAGPAWAIGLQAEYVAFDHALIVYDGGKPIWCDARLFKWQ